MGATFATSHFDQRRHQQLTRQEAMAMSSQDSITVTLSLNEAGRAYCKAAGNTAPVCGFMGGSSVYLRKCELVRSGHLKTYTQMTALLLLNIWLMLGQMKGNSSHRSPTRFPKAQEQVPCWTNKKQPYLRKHEICYERVSVPQIDLDHKCTEINIFAGFCRGLGFKKQPGQAEVLVRCSIQ